MDNPTDFERWKDVAESWGSKNPLRSEIAARHIPPGCWVLDLGAGALVLKKYLHPACRYQPCDLYPRSPDCLVADLNAGQFPPGHYDWVVMLGVFQFLTNPAAVVARCRSVASNAVFSYSPTVNVPPTPGEILWREGEGWINHYSRDEYFSVIREAGWAISKVYRIPCNFVVICHGR